MHCFCQTLGTSGTINAKPRVVLMQKARTQQSARAFLHGLCSTGQQDSAQNSSAKLQPPSQASSWPIHIQPKKHDPVLRFFDICPAYDEYVKEVKHHFLVCSGASTFCCLPAPQACLSAKLTAVPFCMFHAAHSPHVYDW